jgi:hypothetical protein
VTLIRHGDSKSYIFQFQLARNELDSVTAELTFQNCMLFIYNGNLSFMKDSSNIEEEFKQMLLICNQFQMTGVVKVLSSVLNSSNYFYFFSLPDIESFSEVKTKCS